MGDKSKISAAAATCLRLCCCVTEMKRLNSQGGIVKAKKKIFPSEQNNQAPSPRSCPRVRLCS